MLIGNKDKRKSAYAPARVGKPLQTSHSAPLTYLPDGDGNRLQRLLVIALQIPLVDNLLTAIARNKQFHAKARKFAIWKSFMEERRAVEKVVYQKRHIASIIIQCRIRCFISRRKVQRRRLQTAIAKEERRQQAARTLQSFFRFIVARKRVTKMRSLHPEYVRNKAAALIQRVFRGFQGRAIVLNIERRKLLRFLRNWSRGKTGNLFHISVLQEIDAQATIYTAISFAMLPSKPARNLPSLKVFRQYRAGLFALYWQIQNRFLARREEKLNRRAERKLMLYEDLYAHAYENIVRAHLIKEKQREELEEEYRKTQLREAAKRADYLTQQTMLNLHNKQQLKERAEREILWRQQEIIRKEEEWVKQAVQHEYDREWEMMTAEDGWAETIRKHDLEAVARAKYVAEEAKKVHDARLRGWHEAKFIESRRMRASLTEATLLSHIDRYESVLSRQCVTYLKSLPFSDEIQLYFQQKFIGEYSPRNRDKILQVMLLNLLAEHNFSYRLVQTQLLVMNQAQQKDFKVALPDLLKYFALRVQNDDTSRTLLQNRAVLNQVHPLQVKGKLLKIDNHHHFFAREEFLHGVPLQFKMHLPSSNISQYAHLIQYKHIKKVNRTTFRSLSIALAKFKQTHINLHQLRQEMKEGKLLRNARKEKLAQASSCEETLFEVRQKIIDDAMVLYDSIYYEIRLFLDLFYPSENNYYYRSMNTVFESPSAMRMKSQANDNATSSVVNASSSVPAPPDKPMTPGSPHSSGGRRKNSLLRHSIDGSSTTDNDARRAGDIVQTLFQSPDHRNDSTSQRKRSISDASSNSDAENTSKTSSSNVSFKESEKDNTKNSDTHSSSAASSPKDSNTNKSNRKKGAGMARDTARRKSVGSTDNPFASTASPAGPHLNAANRTASKLKLATRKFNYLIDDPEDYWEDLLEVCSDAYALLPTEIIALLPAPPKPVFNHDGFRHILKVKSILVQQSHYGPNGPISRPSMKKTASPPSPKKGKKRVGISFGATPSASDNNNNSNNTANSNEAGGKGHIRWAKKRDIFTPMGPQAKERKFFDIPGENAFMEKDVDKYDFYYWAHALQGWTRDIIQRHTNLSQAWKSKHERQLLTYLHAHRMNYLLSLDDPETSTSPDQSHIDQAHRNVKLQQFIQSPAIDADDIYDLFLCTYEVAITAKVNIGRGKAVESSIKITAPELDYVLSRQPFSYLARQTMIQSISEWFNRYFSMYPVNLQPPNTNQLREFWNHPLIHFKYPWQEEKLEIFPVIAKEYEELADIARVILDNHLLAFDMYNQKLQWHTFHSDHQPADFSNPDTVASPTRLAALRNKILRKIGVTIRQTAEVYKVIFPRFMEPVFRFGVSAPPESFQKQLLREKKAGIVGKYTKIDAKDQKVDIYARKLLRHVFKRCLLKRFLLDCWQAQEILDYDRQAMMLEDARALLIRKVEKEARHKQREKNCSYRFGRLCMSIMVGALLCRPIGPPRVFPGHELTKFDEAYLLLRKINFQQLQKRYLPRAGGVCTDYMTPPVALTSLMRKIVENNYNITESSDIMSFIRSADMFAVVEPAIWEALEQDLADIDNVHITDLTHYRLRSWYTNQVVAVNTETGGQMDMRALLQRHLPEMSALYGNLSTLPEDSLVTHHQQQQQQQLQLDLLNNTSNGTKLLSNGNTMNTSLAKSLFRSKYKATAPTEKVKFQDDDKDDDSADELFDEKALTATVIQSRKKDKFGRSQLSKVSSTLSVSHLPKYRQHCPEYWIAGGLHRVIVAMRVVEQEQINERGIIVVEDIEVPANNVTDLPHIRRTYQHHMPSLAMPPEKVPGSPLAGRKTVSSPTSSSLTSSPDKTSQTSATAAGAAGATATATATATTTTVAAAKTGVGSTTSSNRRKSRGNAAASTSPTAANTANTTTTTTTAASNAAMSVSTSPSNTANGSKNPSPAASPANASTAAGAAGTSTTKSSYRRKNAIALTSPLLPATVLRRHQQEEKAALQRHYALLAAGRGLDGDYNDLCVAMIVRGGFTYHPLCTCCAFSAGEPAVPHWVAQWGDVFQTHQKRYYCRWHWLRIHARHAYHPQHDSYYAYRQDPRFLKRQLFPVWQGADTGKTWSSQLVMPVSIPEKMREDLLRLVLHQRYLQLSPTRMELYRLFVRCQARLRGALLRIKFERERQAMAAAMLSMLRAQALAEAQQQQQQGTLSAGSGGSKHNTAGKGGGGRFSQVVHGGALGSRLSRMSSRLSNSTTNNNNNNNGKAGSVKDQQSVGVVSPPLGGSPSASVRTGQKGRKQLQMANELKK